MSTASRARRAGVGLPFERLVRRLDYHARLEKAVVAGGDDKLLGRARPLQVAADDALFADDRPVANGNILAAADHGVAADLNTIVLWRR